MEPGQCGQRGRCKMAGFNGHAVVEARKAFPAPSGCRLVDSMCVCTRLLTIEPFRPKPGDIPRSLPCRDGQLFLMGVTSSGAPGGCDNLRS